MKAEERAEWLFDDIEVYAWDWAEIDVVKAKIADVIREAEQQAILKVTPKEPVSWRQIYEVLYSMRLAPRHQLEQASKEVAKLFAAPPAPAVQKYKSTIAELCDCFEDVMNGKGGWAWEEVIQDARNFIETAPEPKEQT